MKNSPASKNLKKIFLASDHAGYLLKEFLIKKLSKLDYSPIDLGCNSAEISVDYPDYAQKLCAEINEENCGILICGSGIGISIAANRFKNVRAALCSEVKAAKLARAHNNANVVCLGARFVGNQKAIRIVKAFLDSEFEGGRHGRRVEKLAE